MDAGIRISGDVISKIDDRLYGSFIEHMGRAIYTGIYEPDHPLSDDFGFRQDVADLIRALDLSHIRYPGGNFLSGYNWLDGIGPLASRPARPDLAWFAIEPNHVGTDEFLAWCERLGIAPMLGVNLGTGTPQSATDLLEYVNGDLPTFYADLRRKHGRENPYDVKLWCLGNEMDGPWQICAKTADEYGRIAAETAKMMKWLDPSIELIACGSSFRDMPSFGQWEETVLRHCFPHVDYLSIHQYYENESGDVGHFLARNLEMDDFIKTTAKICAKARQEQGADKNIYLAFDEWNVWYHYRVSGEEAPQWITARPIEEECYDMTDALVVGCMMNTLINNADVVKIACLAQLVNVIAPIMTMPGGKAWAQTTYHPFLNASRYGRGTALKTTIACPEYPVNGMGNVPFLDCAAVQSPDGKELTVFAVNRSPDECITCTVELSPWLAFGFNGASLSGHAPKTVNTARNQPCIPYPISSSSIVEDKLTVKLPAFSWNMLRVSLEDK